MIVKSPNESYTGVIAGVVFVKGQAQTEDKRMLAWFKEKGYKVEKEKKPKVDE